MPNTERTRVFQPVEIDPDAVFTPETLGLLLGVSDAALNRARKDGSLKSSQVGAKVFFQGRWVLEWLFGAEAET